MLQGVHWRRLRPAGLRLLVLPGRPARPVQGDGGEQPPAHADPARAARHHLRPHRQAAGREPQLLQHLDRPRAHQGPRSHDPRAGAGHRRRREDGARHRRPPPARAELPADRRAARMRRWRKSPPSRARRLDFELPDVHRAGSADAPVSGSGHGGAPDRLRRRGQRRSDAVRRRDDRIDRRPVRRRARLQQAADGRGRRQARRRQQRRPRNPHARRSAAGAGPPRAADDQLRDAEGGRGCVPRLRLLRIGGRARAEDRRRADADEHAGVRSQRLRDRHRSRDVGAAQYRQAAAAAESRHPGTLSAGIDVQDRRRDGGARRRRRSRPSDRSTARAAARSTAVSSRATSPAATATSICATRSRSPATPTSTRSATCSASTRCTSGPRSWASR